MVQNFSEKKNDFLKSIFTLDILLEKIISGEVQPRTVNDRLYCCGQYPSTCLKIALQKFKIHNLHPLSLRYDCLLYTSDAADE